MRFIILITLYVLFNVAGQIFLRLGSPKFQTGSNIIETFLIIVKNYQLLMGIFFFGCSFLTWIIILNKETLSYSFPIGWGLTYVGIIITSYFVLKEEFDIIKIIGITLIGIGVILASLSKAN